MQYGFLDFWSTAPSNDSLNPDLQLTPRFKVNNLCPTETGISNLPPKTMESTLRSMAQVLEELYNQIGPFVIASGYRSAEVNKAVGGAPTSRHMMGDAVDISPTTMTAENYWGAILLNPLLANKLGHIAWKPTSRNAIHVTLPFKSSSGAWIQNVPQVTQMIAGSVAYLTATPAQMDTAKNKFLGVPVQSESPVMVAGFSFNWAALGVAMAGLTALGMVIRLRRK